MKMTLSRMGTTLQDLVYTINPLYGSVFQLAEYIELKTEEQK